MEDDQQITSVGRRRARGLEAEKRAGAIERLKALRQGGRRTSAAGPSYDVKLHEPIYQVMEEGEYEEFVSNRRKEAVDFIEAEDADGDLGYLDDGGEEDWTQATRSHSSDESDCGGSVPRRKRAEKKEKKSSSRPHKSAAALSAAAAMMGKQRLASMFTSSSNKKTRETDKFKCESIIDGVIRQFAIDESDRVQRRRTQQPVHYAVSQQPLGVYETVNNVKCDNQLVAYGNWIDTAEEKCSIVKDEKNLEAPFENVSSIYGDASEQNKVGGDVEMKEASPVDEMEEKVVPKFNSKIEGVEKDPPMRANEDWKALKSDRNGDVNVISERKDSTDIDAQLDLELDADGSLPFFIIEAHEEFFGANMGNLYLFGKVKFGDAYHSCCVVLKNMQRRMYAIPVGAVFQEVMQIEKDANESQIHPPVSRKKLQDLASGLKNELSRHLLNLNVSSFSMTPVMRTYAFERSDIPSGDNYILKINYLFKYPPLPADLKGETFSALLGTQCSALELFLVKRKIKGPSWLSISKFSSCSAPQKVSWCKFEVVVDSPKDIKTASSSNSTMEIPPVVVSAINLKTVINEKQNVNEIVSASITCCRKAKIDGPMLPSEWKKPGMLSHFTIIRKLDGGIFPIGFAKEVTDRNTKAGSTVLVSERSEKTLLEWLIDELYKLDSDVLVGHNVSGFDMDVLLHRVQACKVPSSIWSKIGRLKRSVMPKLTKRSAIFGPGASPGIMSCMAGRLLCDTYLSSRDLLKEVSYSLTQLAKTQLKEERRELTPQDIPRMFQTSKSLMELVECGEKDARLSMELMFHLSILPLTRQLTNISGNLWRQTLQGARAQRVEYLLLHAFREFDGKKKYIVPDKISTRMKESKMAKRTSHVEDVDNDELDIRDVTEDHNGQKMGKKGPAYAGGLVLEPKRGLYDKYVLLLDFNSLYPSIIQEYNICFTTVERSSDGLVPRLPSSREKGVLPKLLEYLVQTRGLVKSQMKTASGIELQQLDIRQQALKLTANSMYGCLGFANSRFYAKPLAELITLQGREILLSTVDLVQNNLNLEVIYGDTDSIMIYSGVDDFAKAEVIAREVIKEVNKKYKCLEIDLDGLYKRMLLLKKKKYAAMKVQIKDGKEKEEIECKGLDMVRRDWSLLSKELGDFCLRQILSGGTCEDVVESIHKKLMEVQEEMRNGKVDLNKYVITKTLTKPPEAYPDAKNQPHVQVALRLKQSCYSSGSSAGDTVPYIICCEQGTRIVGSTGIAQRARHPDELKRHAGKWMIDIDYYLSQQIHPVVSRLCAFIQGTSPERLANCLGLDSSKFLSRQSEAAANDPLHSLLFAVDEEDRYRDCAPLILTCPSCSGTFEFPAVFTSILISNSKKPIEQQQPEEPATIFLRKLRCPRCPKEGDVGRMTPGMIANQVRRQAEGFISMYYKGLMTCDEETCKHTTRSVSLKLVGDYERGTVCPNYPRCNGRLVRKCTEADLYKQLAYFCHLLDTGGSSTNKMKTNMSVQVKKELARVKALVDMAASTIGRIRDRCAYGWLQMQDLIVSV